MAKKTPKKKAPADTRPAKKTGAKPAPKSAPRAPAGKPAAAKPVAAKPVASKAVAPKPVAGKKAPPPKGQPAPPKAKAPVPPPKPARALAPSSKSKPPAGQAPSRPAAEAPSTKPQLPAKTSAAPGGKAGRKGITIVTPKPVKKPKPKSSGGVVPALTGSILGMGLGMGRPLIPSGPPSPASPASNADGHGAGRKPKSPFTKRQLDKYREVLIAKRRELLGDIDSMENEALKSQSGSLSHLPQHMAEQGSETYEQSLSLDLAAADRVLLREIDAALQRIEDRTYGLCEHTGRPISKERLAELPWARYSIEAAREMERRTT